ncbi:MAG: transporter substrate-binding domain-containing protein [Chloroflexi bacterium]|nr:transporter substrate-binding domain-containing protein [Chloroflexota bacterium]
MIASLVVALGMAACGVAAGPSTTPTADPTKDKLAQVLARGTLVLSTDPGYAPQSFAVKGATRAAPTKCAPNQLTAPEISGFDAETGKLVAAELGVEPCFVTPGFDQIIAGNWGDRWDVAWGSGALTEKRMKTLYVTQPYYTTPANYFVLASSTYTTPTDLSGKQIGACAGCTHELYLRKTLVLPGVTLEYPVQDPQIVTFASEVPGLAAVAEGKIDAFLCSQPVGAAAIADGAPLRMLDEPAFNTEKTGYVDRGLTLAPGPFLDRINAAIRDLHANGKLKELSIQYFGVDFASAAGSFDLTSVGQTVP